MKENMDFFEKIGRVNPLDDDKDYILTEKFTKTFTNTLVHFTTNYADSFYGCSIIPYKTDAFVIFKIGGFYPYAEETRTSVTDVFSWYNGVTFIPEAGYMVIKLRYKNAFELEYDE